MSEPRQTAPLVVTALRCRCPRCGEGKLFDGYIAVAQRCSVCGLELSGHDSGDGPAFFIMMPLCIITAVLALLFDRAYAPPLWLHALIWPVFIAASVGFTLRPIKALMIALQYRYRNVETGGGD